MNCFDSFYDDFQGFLTVHGRLWNPQWNPLDRIRWIESAEYLADTQQVIQINNRKSFGFRFE